MDEPCSALDPISTSVIEETIRELSDDITIVIVTHNMQQAQRGLGTTAHSFWSMERGCQGISSRRDRPRRCSTIRSILGPLTTYTEYSDDESSDGCARGSTAARPSLAVRSFQAWAQARWVATLPKTRTAVQMAAFLGIVVVAYNYSLTTLLQLADLNTPFAYVSLVPLISLMLAFMHARPRAGGAGDSRSPDRLHHRYSPDGRGVPGQPAASHETLGHVLGVADRPAHLAVLRGGRRGRHLRGAGALAPEGRRRVSPAGVALSLHHGVTERPQRVHLCDLVRHGPGREGDAHRHVGGPPRAVASSRWCTTGTLSA